jgi:hypothetical protein
MLLVGQFNRETQGKEKAMMTLEILDKAQVCLSIRQLCSDLQLTSTWNGYLMNRDRLGIPLRNALLAPLEKMQSGVLLVDLTDVHEMSHSVAEEIGPIFLQSFLEKRLNKPELFTAYINMQPEVIRGLRYAFEGYLDRLRSDEKLVAIGFQDTSQNFEILGYLPEALSALVDAIYKNGDAGMTSMDLEARGIKAASRKLNELGTQYSWLVAMAKIQRPAGADARTWAYQYSPIVREG